MRTSMTIHGCVRMSAILVAAAGSSVMAQNSYTLIDLGSAGYSSRAFSIANVEGVRVAGMVYDTFDFNYHAFLAAEAPTPLLPSEQFSQAVGFDVTPSGVVLGAAYNVGDLGCRAFVDDGQTRVDLGDFTPRAINASGQIAGTANVVTTTFGGLTLPRACRYSNGELEILSTLGGSSAMGLAIDDDGRVAGSSFNALDAASRPCLWSGAVASDLGTLGGALGQVYDIKGDVAVGLSSLTSGLIHATRWTLDVDGAVLEGADLGALSPTGTSSAYAVNQLGDIVGTSNSHAVIWRDGQIEDLNDLAAGAYWVLSAAWDIDDAGRIVGTGLHAGVPRAFLLIPGDNCPACAADFDQSGGISGDDLAAFFAYFERGWPCADVDQNGGIDGNDIATFLALFEAGGC